MEKEKIIEEISSQIKDQISYCKNLEVKLEKSRYSLNGANEATIGKPKEESSSRNESNHHQDQKKKNVTRNVRWFRCQKFGHTSSNCRSNRKNHFKKNK